MFDFLLTFAICIMLIGIAFTAGIKVATLKPSEHWEEIAMSVCAAGMGGFDKTWKCLLWSVMMLGATYVMSYYLHLPVTAAIYTLWVVVSNVIGYMIHSRGGFAYRSMTSWTTFLS